MIVWVNDSRSDTNIYRPTIYVSVTYKKLHTSINVIVSIFSESKV